MRWSGLRNKLAAEFGVAREEPDWLGLRVGRPAIAVAVGRVGSLVELIAGVCRTAQAEPAQMLELARRLPSGGLATEDGAYLLKEVIPLDDRTADIIPAAIRRLAAASIALRATVLPRVIGPDDVFTIYAL
jgi:hypothetical protein